MPNWHPQLTLAEQLATMHAADAIELLNELELSESIGIIAEMPHDHAVLILDQPELHDAAGIIKGSAGRDRTATPRRNVGRPCHRHLS